MNNKATDKNVAKSVDHTSAKSNNIMKRKEFVCYQDKSEKYIPSFFMFISGKRVWIFCVNLVANICRKQEILKQLQRHVLIARIINYVHNFEF